MRLSVFVPAAVLCLVPLACGDSTPDPNDPSQAQNQYGAQGQYPPGQYPPGQYQPGGQYGGQQPGGYPTAPQPQPTAPQPQPTGTAPAGGGQATPINAAMATPVITAIAAGEVQGMQPEGGAFAGQFAEGQTLEQPFNINPGKCYSVVAVALPGGIQELDAQIVVQIPPAPAFVLAQDNATGPNATVGGKGSCFKNPSPFGGPGKVIIRATRGAGFAGAQLYVK